MGRLVQHLSLARADRLGNPQPSSKRVLRRIEGSAPLAAKPQPPEGSRSDDRARLCRLQAS
jgi:hypothetical protein